MKSKMVLLLSGILILASACAHKCPPCPTCGLGTVGSYTSSYQAPAAASSAPSYDNSANNNAASPYSGGPASRYVKK